MEATFIYLSEVEAQEIDPHGITASGWYYCLNSEDSDHVGPFDTRHAAENAAETAIARSAS